MELMEDGTTMERQMFAMAAKKKYHCMECWSYYRSVI